MKTIALTIALAASVAIAEPSSVTIKRLQAEIAMLKMQLAGQGPAVTRLKAEVVALKKTITGQAKALEETRAALADEKAKVALLTKTSRPPANGTSRVDVEAQQDFRTPLNIGSLGKVGSIFEWSFVGKDLHCRIIVYGEKIEAVYRNGVKIGEQKRKTASQVWVCIRGLTVKDLRSHIKTTTNAPDSNKRILYNRLDLPMRVTGVALIPVEGKRRKVFSIECTG